jgi:hypothetical protein
LFLKQLLSFSQKEKMADQGQQQQQAAQRGGGNARRGVGRNAASGAPTTVFLNPERAPPLISKWQKLLGKDLSRIEVVYTADGVTVNLYAKEGTPFEDLGSGAFSVADYKAKKEEAVKPSSEDAKFAFRNKFEVRLNQAFPEGIDLGDGSDTALRSAVMALPFEQRRVMLMSNKQFKSAYPNGSAGAAGAAA